MSHTLPQLPWAKDALAPHISAETITFHHEKHHQAYVNKLNLLIKDRADLNTLSIEELVKTTDGVIFNQAAQVWNHTFYWHSLSPNGGGQPPAGSKIAEAITSSFGTFDAFKDQFSAAAAGHFGSGWAWLVRDENNKLEVVSTHDAENPIKSGKTPVLTCDVWEHAYYIDYRNDRPKYVASWWNVVNWDFAEKNLK
eukprot:TRINITY_DN1448_c0_g1_i1.p1 TRINITY_DN1448_c0_g1~~TRINITY_DN1448_c0_g1_i1.p1  ORF type:complete len:214 (+),score=66.95 TRINITY_DN1448_c0_g1_i1:57-644(+)